MTRSAVNSSNSFYGQDDLKYISKKSTSWFDIAVNKAHTIAFRPRLRDFIDLFFILQQKPEWNFRSLLKSSFEKFEMRADALQVGQNLLEVEKQIDMPIMIKKVNMDKVKKFFLGEARLLDKEIFR